MVEFGRATRERQVRLATGPLLAGALGTVLGIVLGFLIGGGFSVALTVAGALMLLWGVHRLGRLGADPPERAEPSRPGRPSLELASATSKTPQD